jgi:hypothetical protein
MTQFFFDWSYNKKWMSLSKYLEELKKQGYFIQQVIIQNDDTAVIIVQIDTI